MKRRLVSLLMTVALIFGFAGLLPVEYDGFSIMASATQDRTYNFWGGYTLTGNGADDIVAVAQAQNGRSTSSMGYSEAWCANFVGDCAAVAGQGNAIPRDGYCGNLYQNIKDAGGVPVTTPQKGDIIFYYCTASSCPNSGKPWVHVGIMTSSSSSIEGNSGGIVNSKSRITYTDCNGHTYGHSGTNSVIVKYLRPNYDNVPTDKTPPSISNVKVSDVSTKGYTVTCTVTDDGGSGLNRVQFPTWTVANDQDDIDQHWGDSVKSSGTINGNKVTFRVNTSDHNNELGVYRTHIYAYDNAGNYSSAGIDTVLENTPPKISDVKVTNVSSTGYTVECKVTDEGGSGLNRVQFPTWTLANDQDDIDQHWGDSVKSRGTIKGNTVTYRVNISDHNSEYGIYRTHIYAYDNSGNSNCVACEDVRVGWGEEMKKGAGQTIPDGDYIIVSELGQNLYLDIPGVEYPAANGIDVTVCDGSVLPGKSDLFDTWTVKFLGDGFYKITQNGTDMSLDVKNDSLLCGMEIMTHPWHGKSNQRWSIAETNHGYTIQAKSSGWYLDVRGANTATGTKVQMWESNGNKAQHWCFIPVASDERPIPDGEYYIKSKLANVWLDVWGDYENKPFTNGTNIGILDAPKDSFKVKYIGDGYYKLLEVNSGLAVDVDKPSYLNRGGNVQLYENGSNDKRNQLWKIKDMGNGYYCLISKMSGYCIDIAGAVVDNSTNVQQYTFNNHDAQKWSFEKVHKHTATATAAKAATCTANGNTAYWYCSGCKKYFSDSACTKEITQASTVVKAKGHSFGSWTTTKAATCTTDGQQTRKCSTCGTTETKTITKTGHKTTATAAKAATCTTNGNIAYWYCSNCNKYFSDSACTKEITLASTVIKANGHKYIDTVVEPTCTEKGYTNHVCSNCGDSYTDSETPAKGHNYKVETIPPTETTAGYDKHTCTVCGDFYIDNVVPPIPPAPVIEIPTVSYVPGDSAVKLTWTTVSNAEKYAVCGYISGKWQKLAEGNGTSYTLKDLKAGKEYKVAVIAMKNGNWNHDYSNAIVVTPKPDKYPKVTDTEYSEKYHQFRLTWNAVEGATEYGIAVKLGGKWKIQAYTNKTNFTSPKLREGSIVEMVVCAKVNGEWDISSINSRAFKVTVK